MIIDSHILDALTAQAKASVRLRMNYDLRNSAEDGSQRMLNAIEPGTVMPIHRHRHSSETVVCIPSRPCSGTRFVRWSPVRSFWNARTGSMSRWGRGM